MTDTRRTRRAAITTAECLLTRRRPSRRIALGVLAFGALVGVTVVAGDTAQAAELFVSPSGRDTNPGTMAAPFATLQRANTAAAAGDTIWLRGGTYFSTTQIVLSKSGLSDAQRTRIWAYPGEVPILDCSRYLSTNKAADVPSVLVTGSWMHLKGIEIANGPVGVPGDHSISMLRTRNASNNTFELLNIHHGFGPGLFIDTGNGGNLILNCDSHDNYDKDGSQGDGQNADGFGVHYQTTGPSTIIRGCRAWLNSDDGYDLISQEVPVTVEQSWAFQNGFADGGSVSPSSGNGNGFKMGSSATGIRHIVQQNLAWKNKAAGFYANHSTGGNTWLNNTSFMNGTQFNMLASPANDPNTTITLTGALAHIMRNNIGFPDRNSNMGGVDTSFNTWDLNIAQAATDFVSTLDTGATGPRQANGSVPANGFTRLAAGSPLIDKGTNVNLPFVGRAPDLGAFEFGAVANGSGGSSGAGGAVGGVGGAAGRPDAGTTGAGTGGQGATGAGGATGGGGSPATGVGGGAATSIGGNSGGGGTAGGPGGGVDGNASGGCACGLALASPGSPWAVALSALALLALRARRRPARARRAS